MKRKKKGLGQSVQCSFVGSCANVVITGRKATTEVEEEEAEEEGSKGARQHGRALSSIASATNGPTDSTRLTKVN